jgi:hypothetical protein
MVTGDLSGAGILINIREFIRWHNFEKIMTSEAQGPRPIVEFPNEAFLGTPNDRYLLA